MTRLEKSRYAGQRLACQCFDRAAMPLSTWSRPRFPARRRPSSGASFSAAWRKILPGVSSLGRTCPKRSSRFPLRRPDRFSKN